jgi:hypothetical protein
MTCERGVTAMHKKIENAETQNFVNIVEVYPNEHILVRIVEINHEKGVEKGIPLFTSTARSELVALSKQEGIRNETIILNGLNLMPVIGGLL